jgi:hypothetical protein
LLHNHVDLSSFFFRKSLSICNQNPLSTNAGIEFGKIQNNLYNIFGIGFANDFMSLSFGRLVNGANLINRNVNDSTKKSTGFNLSDMIVSCTYNFAPCYASQFVWHYDLGYGNISQTAFFMKLK